MTTCTCRMEAYEDQHSMRAWRKSNKLEHAASQRRAAAAGLHGNAAAPKGGGRSCRQRLRSCSELLGRPRGAALSARPLRNRLRSGVAQDGRHRHHLGVSAAIRAVSPRWECDSKVWEANLRLRLRSTWPGAGMPSPRKKKSSYLVLPAICDQELTRNELTHDDEYGAAAPN